MKNIPVTAVPFDRPEHLSDFRILNVERDNPIHCRKCNGRSHVVTISDTAITLTCEQVSCKAETVIIANMLSHE